MEIQPPNIETQSQDSSSPSHCLLRGKREAEHHRTSSSSSSSSSSSTSEEDHIQLDHETQLCVDQELTVEGIKPSPIPPIKKRKLEEEDQETTACMSSFSCCDVVTRTSVYVTGPYCVETRTEEMDPHLEAGQVHIKTCLSGISSGTEFSIFKGSGLSIFKTDPIDSVRKSCSLNDLKSNGECDMFSPMKSGYCSVGVVVNTHKDSGVPIGTRVFAFHPHETEFVCDVSELQLVPENVSDDDAVFLANMETALAIVHDARPMLGEQVVVFGMGVVGLLVTKILSTFHLSTLIAVDPIKARREQALQCGATACVDPLSQGGIDKIKELTMGERTNAAKGADLTIEVSGNGRALDTAFECTGVNGRVVIASFYGDHSISLNLSSHFHRSHFNIICSQVSNIPCGLSGRWTKDRRFSQVWELIALFKPSQLITNRVPIHQAEKGFKLLENPKDVLQVVFDYKE